MNSPGINIIKIHFILLTVLILSPPLFSKVAGDTLREDGILYVSKLKKLLILQEQHHGKNIVGNEIKSILEPNGVDVRVVATSASATVLNKAALADFDVLLWSFAWEPQDKYNPSMRKAVEDWFAKGGKGVGCLHSCQRSHGWPFYKKVFGSLYNYKWVIPRKAQTMILDESYKKDNMLFNKSEDKDWPNPGGAEEYYLYDVNPRDLPNTQIHYRIEETDIKAIAMGGDHPVIWTREVEGGRSYMNVLNHASHLINEKRRQEYIDNLTKSLYWMAGYDTVRTTVAIQPVVKLNPSGENTLVFSDINHTMEIFNVRGETVFQSGGRKEYDLSSLKGIHYIRIKTKDKVFNKRLVLL